LIFCFLQSIRLLLGGLVHFGSIIEKLQARAPLKSFHCLLDSNAALLALLVWVGAPLALAAPPAKEVTKPNQAQIAFLRKNFPKAAFLHTGDGKKALDEDTNTIFGQMSRGRKL
jgi:hypothetical protein